MAFDPSNMDHIVMGNMTMGAQVTFDGGLAWTGVAGLGAGDDIDVFSAVISPADPNVVYLMVRNEAELKAGRPSEGRHIHKSTDGGRHFTSVAEQDNRITLPNGPVMAADPKDSGTVYFIYGTYYQGYGTDIYKYDSHSQNVSVAHNSYHRIDSIAFHPRAPGLLYFGVDKER
ncbi:hypothetical protein [Amycolatopsis taiwanensis]|nr:hypothetical protein [Amycolatopsis taiwanensis]